MSQDLILMFKISLSLFCFVVVIGIDMVWGVKLLRIHIVCLVNLLQTTICSCSFIDKDSFNFRMCSSCSLVYKNIFNLSNYIRKDISKNVNIFPSFF